MEKKKYVRRGFDIELRLYNLMRAAAVTAGEKTKDWIARAIRHELKRSSKKT